MTTLRQLASLMFFGLAGVACSDAQVTITRAFPNLSFEGAVDLQHPGDGSNRLFVVEQRGVIRVFENSAGIASTTNFLDIQDRVASGGEMGLLGLAFHPNYETNGYFYVDYTADDPRRTVIARYSVSQDNPLQADPNSEVVLLTIDQPYPNHNGGQIAFGPDGYLYIAMGDGGAGNDPQNHGQNTESLLGKILRIDVDGSSAGAYGIPADNPFVGMAGYAPEIWAYGLRNPWRFSFDPVTGWLWAGDVGQGAREEIDLIEKGKNYGWRIREGYICTPNVSPSNCDSAGLTSPIFDYPRTSGVSITGGHVYRGMSAPQLTGKYLYADFGTGRVWSLAYDGITPPVNTQIGQVNSPSSFGIDRNGELYLLSFNGSIYKFTSTSDVESEEEHETALRGSEPNPTRGATTIAYSLARAGHVKVALFDMLGRETMTIVDRQQEAGSHSVRFDTGALRPGIYTYTLSTGGRVIGERMVITR